MSDGGRRIVRISVSDFYYYCFFFRCVSIVLTNLSLFTFVFDCFLSCSGVLQSADVQWMIQYADLNTVLCPYDCSFRAFVNISLSHLDAEFGSLRVERIPAVCTVL
jgi:hypothetical protein